MQYRNQFRPYIYLRPQLSRASSVQFITPRLIIPLVTGPLLLSFRTTCTPYLFWSWTTSSNNALIFDQPPLEQCCTVLKRHRPRLYSAVLFKTLSDLALKNCTYSMRYLALLLSSSFEATFSSQLPTPSWAFKYLRLKNMQTPKRELVFFYRPFLFIHASRKPLRNMPALADHKTPLQAGYSVL